MPTVEERLAHLEGQANELSQGLSDVRAAIRHLEQRIDRLEQRVDARFDALDNKMSRQFMWLVGIQITMVLAVVTTLGAIVVALISRA